MTLARRIDTAILAGFYGVDADEVVDVNESAVTFYDFSNGCLITRRL